MVGHRRPGELGLYIYEVAPRPESFTRVRHLIGGNSTTVQKLDVECSEAMLNLLSDPDGSLHTAIERLKEAPDDTRRIGAAHVVMHTLQSMCPGDTWRSILVGGIDASRIKRLSKICGMSAEGIRLKIFRKLVATLSCHKVDLMIPTETGTLNMRAVGSRKWALTDPQFSTRGRLTSRNKSGGLTDSTSLFDYLIAERVVQPRWTVHMLLEVCTFLQTYGSAVTTMVDKRFPAPSRFPTLEGLETEPKFEIDRTEDVTEFAEHTAI